MTTLQRLWSGSAVLGGDVVVKSTVNTRHQCGRVWPS